MLRIGDVCVIFLHTDGRYTMNRWDHYGDCCYRGTVNSGKSKPVLVRVDCADGMRILTYTVIDTNVTESHAYAGYDGVYNYTDSNGNRQEIADCLVMRR